MNDLARRIKKDMKSLIVQVVPSGVLVKPAFQPDVIVTSWEEYRKHVDSGRITPTDEECAW